MKTERNKGMDHTDMENAKLSMYPIQKRVHKYYLCECGTECKVQNAIDTDWYGKLEYMWCPTCEETMVAQNGCFRGIAAKR